MVIVLGIISVLVFITISLDEITEGGKMDRKTIPRLRCQRKRWKGEKKPTKETEEWPRRKEERREAKPNVSRGWPSTLSTTAASKTRAENWSQAVTRMELATCSSLVTFDKSSFKGVVEAKVLVKMGSSKELHTNVHSSFIHNTYNLETVQVFANRWMDKQKSRIPFIK